MTDNGAYSWAAAVQETVDATLNRTVSSGKVHGPLLCYLFACIETDGEVRSCDPGRWRAGWMLVKAAHHVALHLA